MSKRCKEIWLKRMAELPPGLTIRQLMDRFGVSYYTIWFWTKLARYQKVRAEYVFRNGRKKRFNIASMDMNKPIPVLAKEHGVSKQYAYAEVKRWKQRQAT